MPSRHVDEQQRGFLGQPQREPEVRQHDLGAGELLTLVSITWK
jgi:hypothetical protein